MKTVYKIILLTIIPFVAFSQGFTTSGGNLIDNNGNNFIMKGMNVPLAWYVSNVNNSIDDLRTNTGSNCLRIVVETGTNTTSWQTAVQNCIDNDMIPMVELHDVTGSTSTAAVQTMANFWIQNKNFLTQPGIVEYILINICNEWGTWATANTNGSAWRDAFNTAVTSIRNAGINTTLVIDAVGYGQDIDDAKNIRAYAAGMITNDPQHNLLFSIHMYCEWSQGGDDIPGTLQWARDNNIPLIVGEFGYQHATDGSCNIDEQLILDQCQAKGIGWLAWSQKGNGSPVEYLDLCNDWECTNLSTWGNTVINGSNGTKTAVTATVFDSNPNLPPTVSISSPANGFSTQEPASIEITATANDSDGSIVSVAFYNGTTLLATDNAAPYAYTWNNVTQGTYTLTAKASDDKGAVATASSVSITVTQNPCPYPNLGDDMSMCEGDNITLNAAVATTGVSYSWQRNGSSIPGTSPSLSVSEFGTYTITASKSGCDTQTDNIIITNAGLTATHDEICEAGAVLLSINGTSGGPYKWYDSETGGTLLTTGTSYNPTISNTTTFYVEDGGAGESYSLGLTEQTSGAEIWGLSGDDVFGENDKDMQIVVGQTLTIDAISVYSQTTLNSVTIRILSGTTVIHTATVSDLGTGKQRVPLGFELTPGTYRIDAVGTTGTLGYQADLAQLPYEVTGVMTLTGTQTWVISEGRYGLFYDWEISTGSGPSCGRTPVTGTINPNGNGCNVTQTVDLTTGWNLIGCPISGSTDLQTALSSIWNYVEVVKDNNGFFMMNQDSFLNSLDAVQFGYGYLIKVSQDCTLTW